jgi:hypothetical protein
MIALIEEYGGWIDPGSAGYARQTDIARKMLAGEIDPHLEPNDFSGRTVAEQLLWGGASSLSAEIVRMALEHVDWLPDDPRWFWMLWRPLHPQQQAECCECFKLILVRCGPLHRASDYGQTMLHEVVARDHGVGFSSPRFCSMPALGLACATCCSKAHRLDGRAGAGAAISSSCCSRGADPIEADAEPWATPRAWSERMHRSELLELLTAASDQRSEWQE